MCRGTVRGRRVTGVSSDVTECRSVGECNAKDKLVNELEQNKRGGGSDRRCWKVGVEGTIESEDRVCVRMCVCDSILFCCVFYFV